MVERVQRTALEEFWPTVELDDPQLGQRLDEWQHFYNWQRPHDSLGGRSPIDRICERLQQTPLQADVNDAFDPSKEPLRTNDHAWDVEWRMLQR